MADKNKARSTGKMHAQMDQFFARIGKLTKIQRLIICLVTLLLMCAGYYYLVFSPKYDALMSSRKTLEKKEQQLTSFKARARMLAKYEQQMAEAQEQFNIAMSALPDKKEVPALLTQISEAGTRSGLTFNLFQPEALVQKDFYKEIPISMDVTGSYHQIADFFFQVANLNRIVNVRNMALKQGGKGQINMKCSAVTYMFSEPKKAPSKNKRKKK